MNGNELPRVQTSIPGPQSRAWVDRLAAVECPAITARRARRAATLGLASDDPIVWTEAVSTPSSPRPMPHGTCASTSRMSFEP